MNFAKYLTVGYVYQFVEKEHLLSFSVVKSGQRSINVSAGPQIPPWVHVDNRSITLDTPERD